MVIKKHPIGSSIKDFRLGEKIGSGGFGKVYEARCLQPGYENNHVAIKKIDKYYLNRSSRERMDAEISIHSKLSHPAIVKFYTSFEDRKYLYLVLELCAGGSFEKYLKTKRNLSEEKAYELIKQVIDGVQYLHINKIIHRDLSLRNLLLTDAHQVKIADFGFADKLNPAEMKNTVLGTVNFMAPEVVKHEPYDFKADCWSVGCVLYNLLYGKPPFYDEKKECVVNRIKEDELSFPDYATSEAKKLLMGMLEKNPKERTEIKGVLLSAFFQKYGKCNTKNEANLTGGDSGMSSLSSSASFNSRFVQKCRSYDFDANCNDSKKELSTNSSGCRRFISQQSNNVESEIQRTKYSSEMKKSKCASGFANQLKSKIQSLPCRQASYDLVLSKETYLENRDYKTHKEINNQTYVFNIGDGCTYSTKQVPYNVVRNSSYSDCLYKRNDSYHPHEIYEKESKDMHMKNFTSEKTSEDIPTPLTSVRLKSRRKRIAKNVFISILNDGQVSLELLKFRKSKEYVSHVYFISCDGMSIKVYRPKRKILLSDQPPPLPDNNQEVQEFTLENLPKLHWKKYHYAKRFVDIIRAKTPKVIIYEKYAKCVMMENAPDHDYEVHFYNGYQIMKVGQNTNIKDENGCDVFENGSNFQFMLNVFQKMKEACKFVEKCGETGLNSNFPITVGRKPDVPGSQDSNKENITSRYIHSYSFNGTATNTKSHNTFMNMGSNPSQNLFESEIPSSSSSVKYVVSPYHNVTEDFPNMTNFHKPAKCSAPRSYEICS